MFHYLGTFSPNSMLKIIASFYLCDKKLVLSLVLGYETCSTLLGQVFWHTVNYQTILDIYLIKRTTPKLTSNPKGATKLHAHPPLSPNMLYQKVPRWRREIVVRVWGKYFLVSSGDVNTAGVVGCTECGRPNGKD